MATDTSPLDERLYSQPAQNAWYMGRQEDSQFQFPYMSENMIHHYFKDSPFFDWTTKNGLELAQAPNAWDTWVHAHDRKKFEEGIASRIGTEYMIVEGEDIQFDREDNPIKGGVWVIRKQERTKNSLEVLGTYYIVRENVYQAPSVGDILGTRLLSASTALSKCFSQAATLTRWTPTAGHTYPTTAVANKNAATTAASSGTTPAASTPGFEREASLAAEGNSQRAGSSAPAGLASSNRSATTADALANRLLLNSMQQSVTYGEDPFTDENPLQGEPGNLSFAVSTAAAKKKKADAEAAATKAKEEALQAAAAAVAASAAAAEAALAAASKPATPAASPTTPGGKVGKKVKKDKKRRKSKHDANSPPMSPTESTPAATPGPAV